MWIKAHPNDLVLIEPPLSRSCLQKNLHSEVLRITTLTWKSGVGDTIQPILASMLNIFFFFFFKIFIYSLYGCAVFWCCTQAVSGCSAWASHCSAFPCCRAQALGMPASVVVARWPRSDPLAFGVFQGLNPSPLHWQPNSLPLSHQGSP